MCVSAVSLLVSGTLRLYQGIRLHRHAGKNIGAAAFSDSINLFYTCRITIVIVIFLCIMLNIMLNVMHRAVWQPNYIFAAKTSIAMSFNFCSRFDTQLSLPRKTAEEALCSSLLSPCLRLESLATYDDIIVILPATRHRICMYRTWNGQISITLVQSTSIRTNVS
jgi:hypothetical protein